MNTPEFEVFNQYLKREAEKARNTRDPGPPPPAPQSRNLLGLKLGLVRDRALFPGGLLGPPCVV